MNFCFIDFKFELFTQNSDKFQNSYTEYTLVHQPDNFLLQKMVKMVSVDVNDGRPAFSVIYCFPGLSKRVSFA